MMKEKKMTNNQYTEGTDYKFIIPEEVSDNIDIELLIGEYKGVVYRYGGVKIDEDGSGGAVLSFNYDVIEDADIGTLEEDEQFKNHIGNILVSLIEKRMASETEEV